ncbi:MAG: calcium/proton exchanger [Chloroflexaceae bacterium]|nr:calcium/proton exchanger [Chloroflexaceae bacterium]
MNWLRLMLVFIPLAFVAEFLLHNPLLIFGFSCLALIPLAGLLGEATEELAIHTGPQIGGLLNATLGNAAELIIAIVALSQGRIDLVKASLTGSIIGNLLLILGASLLLGGLRHGLQKFNIRTAGVSAAMMTLAIIGLLVPTLFELLREVQTNSLDVFDTTVDDPALAAFSLGVAGVLILMYVLSLVFSFTQPEYRMQAGHGHGDTGEAGSATPAHTPKWSIPVAGGVLAAATLGIVFLSEFLVGAVEPVAEEFGLSEVFIGIIIIPLVGNVAEHIVGVQAAAKNQMDLSLAISLGSSQQIALFVAPILVFIGVLLGQQMDLFFNAFEIVILFLAVLLANLISLDGESNWLEGAQLLAVYVIAALGFFFIT